jgi:hypothetical protein
VFLRLEHRREQASLDPLHVDRAFHMPVGDVLPRKAAVDVFLEGHAYASSADPTAGAVRVRVGPVDRSFRISGRRVVEWHRDRPRIGAAAAFERVPFDREHAYGGISLGHPYWRNPGGKGYLVDGDTREGIELPNIEEAHDLLTLDRLVDEPSAWWRRPRPALTAPLVPIDFPRIVDLGWPSAFVPPPRDPSLAEIVDGDLPPDFSMAEPFQMRRAVFQQAPARSRLATYEAGAEVVVEGCLPHGEAFRAKLPEAPPALLEVEGRRREIELLPQSVTVRPEEGALSIVYFASAELHRAFVPGLHKRIPIALELLGERFPYPTPEPVLARVRRAQSEAAPSGGESPR